MRRYLFVILCMLGVSCTHTLVVHDFGHRVIQAPPEGAFSAAIKTLAELGYTVDFADEKSGVINTGWHSYNVQRGAAKVSWGIQSRALIVIGDTGQLDLRFETQAAYGSAFGSQYFQPLYDGDEAGLQVAMAEHQRLIDGLSTKFQVAK